MKKKLSSVPQKTAVLPGSFAQTNNSSLDLLELIEECSDDEEQVLATVPQKTTVLPVHLSLHW